MERIGREVRCKSLPPVKESMQELLLNLPCFKNFDDRELILLADQVPGGNKTIIEDRLTAIVLLIGTKSIDHPSLQVPFSLDEFVSSSARGR